jgi:hypothetical protein
MILEPIEQAEFDGQEQIEKIAAWIAQRHGEVTERFLMESGADPMIHTLVRCDINGDLQTRVLVLVPTDLMSAESETTIVELCKRYTYRAYVWAAMNPPAIFKDWMRVYVA